MKPESLGQAGCPLRAHSQWGVRWRHRDGHVMSLSDPPGPFLFGTWNWELQWGTLARQCSSPRASRGVGYGLGDLEHLPAIPKPSEDGPGLRTHWSAATHSCISLLFSSDFCFLLLASVASSKWGYKYWNLNVTQRVPVFSIPSRERRNLPFPTHLEQHTHPGRAMLPGRTRLPLPCPQCWD